jgi:signal transduction histidine kinase
LLNISLTVSPIRNEQGELIGASKVARDITERKRLQAERDSLFVAEKIAREHAEEASRSKDEFLAVVSHELRSPLNAISGWASLLKTGKLDEPQLSRAVDLILKNVRAQDQLINDLLDISRIVSGRLRLNVRPFELVPVIQEAVEVVRPGAEAKGIRLELVLDAGTGTVAGDSDRLQQVFANLLSNSVKFTPKGGRIQVRLERINSHIEVSFNDTGQGIDSELLPHVFEVFKQVTRVVYANRRGLDSDSASLVVLSNFMVE